MEDFEFKKECVQRLSVIETEVKNVNIKIGSLTCNMHQRAMEGILIKMEKQKYWLFAAVSGFIIGVFGLIYEIIGRK